MNKVVDSSNLSIKKILLLWIPLATMWLMMGIEMPLINAAIARLGEAKTNLAAFGITLAISLIIEAPVIQLLTAGTALAKNKVNYKRLLKFMHILAISLTLFHLIMALTPLYGLLLKYVIAVPEEIIPISKRAFLWMFPWTAAVGYRRLWQGVLIRYERTKVIPLTMVTRLIATLIILLSGFYYTDIAGAEVGALALSFGVSVGALSSYFFFRKLKPELSEKSSDIPISWTKLIRFYFPLALTNFVTFIVRPFLSFGIARAIFPLESLAIWPVVISLNFLFRSMALAFQEVAVSLLKDKKDIKQLAKFASLLSLGLAIIFIIVASTPLSNFWYKNIAGLESELLSFTRIPTLVIVLVPSISALISWHRGLLIFHNRTSIIAKAIFLNSAILLILIMIGPLLFDIPGAILAAFAYTFSMFIELLFLRRKTSLIF